MALPMSKQNLHLFTQWLYSDKRIHAGFDYPIIIGTPVYAVRAGRILKAVGSHKNLDVAKDGTSETPLNFVLLGITYKHKPATVVYLHVSPNLPVRTGDDVD